MNRIKDIRKSRGLTQAQVAEALGLHLTNYNKLENGETKLSLRRMEQLATIMNCDIVDLIASQGSTRMVQVRQSVEAGHWEESPVWPEDQWYDVAVPDDAEYRHLQLFAAETRGPSMNKRYADRSVLIYTSAIGTQERPVPGRRYIVEIERADGLREATVKTLWQADDGKFWLLPESTDPRHQTPIEIDANDGDMIRIVGRVVYSVQRES